MLYSICPGQKLLNLLVESELSMEKTFKYSTHIHIHSILTKMYLLLVGSKNVLNEIYGLLNENPTPDKKQTAQ